MCQGVSLGPEAQRKLGEDSTQWGEKGGDDKVLKHLPVLKDILWV